MELVDVICLVASSFSIGYFLGKRTVKSPRDQNIYIKHYYSTDSLNFSDKFSDDSSYDSLSNTDGEELEDSINSSSESVTFSEPEESGDGKDDVANVNDLKPADYNKATILLKRSGTKIQLKNVKQRQERFLEQQQSLQTHQEDLFNSK